MSGLLNLSEFGRVRKGTARKKERFGSRRYNFVTLHEMRALLIPVVVVHGAHRGGFRTQFGSKWILEAAQNELDIFHHLSR